ncbi:MAG: carbohydrate binding domain-containing protein [Candidatus Hydrogenedentes bacterium]|nr:carbohydrate binding domain-containing protein [Candidatus Hydrogenedentota bacterium]
MSISKMVFAILLTTGFQVFAEEWDPPNLVANSGFEEASDSGLPAGWSGDRSAYSRDTAAAHSGEASLKFVNADPDKYVLCAQHLPFEVGKKYRFSAWVKSEGIEGEDHGATICIEYVDADGKWAGGAYCRTGLKGTTDWTQLEGVSAPVPEGVVGGTVAC